MRRCLRFLFLCFGKPPAAGGDTRQIYVCDQGGGLLFNDAPLVLCWEVANCRQQALIIFVVDAQLLSDSSPHCIIVHVAQDNYYLRDLINLESANLSKHLLLFIDTLHFAFSTFNYFQGGIYWRSSFWCYLSIWYGRRSNRSPTRPTWSTPTDASSIESATFSGWSIPTPWIALPIRFPWKSSW